MQNDTQQLRKNCQCQQSANEKKQNDTVRRKKELRSFIRKTLATFRESPLYKEYSKKAAQNFLTSELYAAAPLILAFVSLKNEIDTHPLIEKMMKDGKKVAVPLTSDTSMFFKLLDNGKPLCEQLRRGNYDIEEPLPELEEIAPETLPAGTVVLVPGMAFSQDGARLGKGKGYYDTYLARVPATTKLVGYAFQTQIIEAVPCEMHDKKANYLATEERITECKI